MGHQRSPELGRVTETPVYRRQQHTQSSTHYQTDVLGPQQSNSHPHHHPHAQFTHPGPVGGQEVAGYPSYLSMATGPTSRARQKKPQEEENEESEAVKTEGLLRSKKAVLPSEIRRRERSTEDPWRGRPEEELGASRVLSLSQAREAEGEDHTRGGYRGRARLDESQHTSRLQAPESRPRERDSAIYIRKALTATHIQPRLTHAATGNSTSGTDTGDRQVPSQRHPQHQAHDSREVRQGESFSNQESQQDSRVSVAQLRHSYMESTTTPPTSRRNEL